MKIRLKIASTLFLLSAMLTLNAQDTIRMELNGYVNNLWTYNFVEDELFMDYLLHNRLKYRLYTPKDINVVIDIRSRMFIGDQPKLASNFPEQLDQTNDYFDLSLHSKGGRNILFHTMIDRFYLEWLKGDWEIRAGRQRINWGLSLAWNPHDLFNTYSFYDFDHVERPGSDALRVTRYFGMDKKLEFAIKPGDNLDELTTAFLYKWNAKTYDFQIISGKTDQDIVAGFGWAGSVGNSGFKGEMTLVYPYEKNTQLNTAFIVNLGIDHAFQNNLYFNYSILFNSDGSDDLTSQEIFDVSNYRNLSPFKFSFLLQHNYVLRERYSLGLSTIYFPGKRNAIFLSPSFQFTIIDDWDIAVLSQFYFDKILGDYEAVVKAFYLRLNYSF